VLTLSVAETLQASAKGSEVSRAWAGSSCRLQGRGGRGGRERGDAFVAQQRRRRAMRLRDQERPHCCQTCNS
jgi:hypothetical protein